MSLLFLAGEYLCTCLSVTAGRPRRAERGQTRTAAFVFGLGFPRSDRPDPEPQSSTEPERSSAARIGPKNAKDGPTSA